MFHASLHLIDVEYRIGSWKLARPGATRSTQRGTPEPGGERTLLPAEGRVNQNLPGAEAAIAQALGPDSKHRIGEGEVVEKRFVRPCAAAPPSGCGWRAAMGRFGEEPRGSRLRRELSRADLPDDCRTPVCRIGTDRRNHGHLHRPAALGTEQRKERRMSVSAERLHHALCGAQREVIVLEETERQQFRHDRHH